MENSVYTGLLAFAVIMLVGIFVSTVLGCIIRIIWLSSVVLLTLIGEHRDRVLRRRAFEGCSRKETKGSSRQRDFFFITESLITLNSACPAPGEKFPLISGEGAVFKHPTVISNDRLLIITTDGEPRSPSNSPQAPSDLGLNPATCPSKQDLVQDLEGIPTVIQLDLSGPSEESSSPKGSPC